MLIVVDSAQRNVVLGTGVLAGLRIDTPEEYTLTTKVPVKDGMRVLLRSVMIPKSIYPVITGFNDTINIIEPGPIPGTVVIPGGRSYTGQQLSDAINTAFAGTLVSWSETTGKLTWVTAIDILSVPTVTPANRFLIGSGDVAITSSVELPWMVDLSYPRWLRLDMTFGIDRGHATMDTTKSYAFQVPFATSDFGAIEYNAQGEQWLQREPIPDINVSTISVKWSLPDDDVALDMEGVNHQIVVEVL